MAHPREEDGPSGRRRKPPPISVISYLALRGLAVNLETLVLARQGILEPEFCSVEEHLGKVQQEYYDALTTVGQGSWHPEGDTRPWIRFMLSAHYVQALRVQWRINILYGNEISFPQESAYRTALMALMLSGKGCRCSTSTKR